MEAGQRDELELKPMAASSLLELGSVGVVRCFQLDDGEQL